MSQKTNERQELLEHRARVRRVQGSAVLIVGIVVMIGSTLLGSLLVGLIGLLVAGASGFWFIASYESDERAALEALSSIRYN